MGGKVLAVVGARLNSSRLPGKQLLPLAGHPMIEHIVKRLTMVPEIDNLILATTDDSYNKELCLWAAASGVDCLAYEGDVNDLVGRVEAAVQRYNPDILLYVCGDCPLVEPSTITAMIREMHANPETDIARLKVLRDGGQTIHEGFDLYRRGFWDKIVEASTEPFEREHIGAAAHHSKKVTPSSIAWVDDDPEFSSFDHRISVDTKADYDFMRLVYDAWYKGHAPDTIVSLRWVIQNLKKNKAWRQTNQHVRQKQVGEKGLCIRAIVGAGGRVGRGHVTRTVVLLRAMQEIYSADVQMLIIEESHVEVDCQGIRNSRLPLAAAGEAPLAEFASGADIMMVDLPVSLGVDHFPVSTVDAFKVFIDHTVEGVSSDLLFVPSFYHVCGNASAVDYGWQNYLVPKVARRALAEAINSVIVITGTNMAAAQLKVLADEIAGSVPPEAEVIWVGPGESDRDAVRLDRKNWKVWPVVPGLAQRLSEFDMAITAYGVSFFECLNMGLPTVVFNSAQTISEVEWDALRGEEVALLADEMDDVGAQVRRVVSDRALRQSIVDRALCKMPNDAGLGAAASIIQAYLEDKGEM